MAKKEVKKKNGKMVNGKLIVPCKYKGNRVGHGTYMAAKFESGGLVLDENGKPVAYSSVGVS